MQKKADIALQENIIFISGELHFSTVMSVYQKSLSLLQKSTVLHFDFSQVTASDSAGLALIIEWVNWAKKHNKPISFQHLSAELLVIAKAAGIDELIRITA